MDSDTLAAIAMLTATSPQGPVRGTAFLVAPDLVATALHNVSDFNPTSNDPPVFFSAAIKLKFPDQDEMEAKPYKWDVKADCALLRCSTPPQCGTLTLQSLERSGGAWETFGFPNMQSQDGLTLDGTVTNHASKLLGGPAFQLYCQQLAAATGGDARGVSGGPMLMRDVVVGLMRFTLGEAGRTSGGVIYACSAQFIAALDPALAVRPMPPVPPLLDDVRMAELIKLYLAQFSPARAALENILCYSLGTEVEGVTNPELPFDKIVSNVLTWANRQGSGPMETLLNATIRAFPKGDIAAFGAAQVPEVLRPTDIGNLIFRITLGLNAVFRLVPGGARGVSLMAPYRGDIQTTLRQIKVLEKYKALHSIMHNVQLSLTVIDTELNGDRDAAAPAAPAKFRPNATLQQYADDVSDFAQDAENKIVGLITASREQKWISGLKARAAEMAKVAQTPTSLGQRNQLFISLRSLVSDTTARINELLATAAGDLRLLSLVDMIDSVTGMTAPAGQQVQELSNGAAAVAALHFRVSGLVKEHSGWQEAIIDLESARISISHRPEDKIGDWPDFEAKVRALCSVYPAEAWSVTLMKRLNDWIKAAPSAAPDDDEVTAGETAFQGFYGSCKYRFYNVDGAVENVSAKIIQLAPALQQLLPVQPGELPAAPPPGVASPPPPPPGTPE
jgi:hypothetical protein